MKHLSAIQQGWFLVCIVGALVAPIVPNFVTGGVILVGLILLVHEKDVRYPTLTWPDAVRTYRRSHQWTVNVRLLAFIGTVWCLDLIAEHQTRGIYLACLGVYELLRLALPVRLESEASAAATEIGGAAS